MFFSHKAMMSLSGVSLPLDAIRQLQIDNGSPCWGMWLRYWDKKDGLKTRDDNPPHLVVCPFHPSTWPCLLHISLKLSDRSGSVFDALSALSECGVSVLSIVCAPSGHNHETMDLVGTIPSVLKSSQMQALREIINVNASIDDQDRQKIITQTWAEPLLLKIEGIKDKIYSLDNSVHFLRDRYRELLKGGSEDSGLAFNRNYLNEETRKAIGSSHGMEAVKISWLQYPAFYTYHGEFPYIELIPSIERRLIEPVGFSRESFRKFLPSDIVNLSSPVLPVLASVDAMSRFVRFMPMRDNEKYPCEIEIAVTHEKPIVIGDDLSSSEKDKSSLGVLASIAEAVCKSGGNLCHMSNSIVMKGSSKESSKIHLIVTDTRGKSSRPNTLLEKLTDTIVHSKLENLPKGSRVHPPSICRFDCLNIFVSKRNDQWVEEGSFGEKCATVTRQEILKCGYRAIEDPPIDGIGNDLTRPGIIEMIGSSHGMLVFIFAEDTVEKNNSLQWILWELGVADGKGIPYTIVVESNKKKTHIGRVKEMLSMTQGKNYEVITANDYQNKISKIVQSLVGKIHKNSKMAGIDLLY